MKSADFVASLRLPAASRVDQRVPKKLLVENGAPTAADKRKINDGIEELTWLAALRPTNVGIPEFRDNTREYLEVAVLDAVLRAPAKSPRLNALIHRAIPYPLLLITTHGDQMTISLAHKRSSLGGKAATVVDGALVVVPLSAPGGSDVDAAFRDAMSFAEQPHGDLLALYQGWIDTAVALICAQVTGKFMRASSAAVALARREALAEWEALDADLRKARSAAAKERQVAKRVTLNADIKRMQAKQAAARAKL